MNCDSNLAALLITVTLGKSQFNKAIVDRAVHSRHSLPPTGDAAYRQHAGGGPSHGHRQHARKFGKDRACASGDIFADRQTDTHRQTDILITILRNRSRRRSKQELSSS